MAATIEMLVKLIGVLVGGIAMGLTPAPINAYFLGWIALAPLWVVIVAHHKNAPKYFDKVLFALAWRCAYHGLALSWITGIHPMTWMGVPWLASLAIALGCWLFITAWGAALVVIWSLGMSYVSKYSNSIPVISRVMIGAALWCGLELIWSNGSLWWTSLSYTQSPLNLAILQLGKGSGPSTITAAIVIVNGLIAEAVLALRKPNRGEISVLVSLSLLVCLSLHVLGWGIYRQPLAQPENAALEIGIIQGNVPNEIKLSPVGWRRAIEGYTEGYRSLAEQGVDGVLTPEGALPFFQSKLKDSSFIKAVREQGVVAWLGAFGERERGYTNSLFTVTETGKFISHYDKVNLVPIGEYVPFEKLIGGLVERLSPLDEHQVAGAPNQILATPFGQAIAGICYDSAFARHFRRQAAQGGEFILTASNNAHYSRTMPAQHHAQDVMRAIETDRWAARATNTGYSAIVDPHGRTLWISDINTYELHAGTIYRRQTQTPYVRWGDWLTPTLLVLAAIAWLFHLIKLV